MPFQRGQLAGDYEVLDVLGKGGMGHVYRVRNVISDRIEAMKVLLDDVGAEADLEDRFIAEIRTLARLDHPNIAKLHTAFKAQKQLLMVMEYVDGVDLAQRAKEGSIPVYKVLGYVKEVLSALTYAHKRGVVHRDIKPSNVMVTPQGGVKLMDFGIAKSNAEPLLTRPGTTLGSLLYMSPEQVRGNPVDARSDLYSMGIVLYELTAGRCPFEAESTYQILDAQLNTAPLPPIEINPSLPRVLSEVILTALEKDPAKRFQSAEAFRKVLDSLTAIEDAGRTRLISDSDLELPPASTLSSAAAAPMPSQLPPRPPAPPAFTAAPPVPPAIPLETPAAKPQVHRTFAVAAAAIACLCILGAGLLAFPHFRKSSAASIPAHSGNVTPNTGGVPLSSPRSPSDALSPNGASSQADNSDIAAMLPPVANGSSSSRARISTPKSTPRSSPPPKQDQAQLRPPQSPQASQPPPPAVVTPPPAPAGPSKEDLEKANEALVNMEARIQAVGQSLTNLKQQMAPNGLRGDMVASESRMNSYFQMAQRAVQNKDLDSAQKYLDRTEEEVTKLEHFLGR